MTSGQASKKYIGSVACQVRSRCEHLACHLSFMLDCTSPKSETPTVILWVVMIPKYTEQVAPVSEESNVGPGANAEG